MKIIGMLILFSFGVYIAHAQDDGLWINRIPIDSTLPKVPYLLNNGKDTLFLDALYSDDHSFNKTDPNKFISGIENNKSDETIQNTGSVDLDWDHSAYSNCWVNEVQLVDSIDFNGDGIKELVLLREWYCSSGPKPSLMNEFGVGGQQERSACYEIWDITTKQQLGTLNFYTETTIIVSTNVVWSHGYRYEVKFNRNGTIALTNISGIVDDPQDGTYKYDSKFGVFNKIRS